MSETPAKPLSDAEKLDRLRLIRSENVGPVTFHRLLERFGSAGDALAALPDLARRGGRSGRIRICTKSDATAEMETAARLGAQVIAWGEAAYPPLLFQIEDAPPLLFAIGHPHLLRKRAVAMVGSRNASINGQRLAEKMAGELGRGGLLVVSGLARGIDAAAHRGALDSGTAAVVAGGVDVIYPKENCRLHGEIVERGVIISEMPCNTQPQSRHFPRRNRLISGMARGVVVVEAGKRSGSLITARMAAEQGREVFAVPGSPLDPRSGGANELIRQGAMLTESASDVLDALKRLTETPLAEPNALKINRYPTIAIDDGATNKARETITQTIDSSPVEVDEIIRACQLPPPVAFTALLELELAGRLERHPGNRVSLIQPV